MQKEGVYIHTWCKMAEASLGWGDSAHWGDHDFEKLSELILKKTGTMLSITTLKRLWGRVKYNSTPNAATLNTMAAFLAFDDWRTFKKNAGTDTEPTIITGAVINPVKKNYLPVVLSAAAIVLVLGGLIAWTSMYKAVKKTPVNAPVKFESRKITEGLPNSVVFDYDATALNIDTVTLQQTWDPKRTEKLSARNKQHTSIYYYPGYFTASLIANGEVKKKNPVYIKTNGWIGIIDKDPVPTYLSNADIHLPGAMGISSKTLALKTGSPVFNNQLVGFYNVREFDDLQGGDFTLETTLRNTSTPNESSCRKAILYILGKQNAIIIPLSAKGCSSALNLYTSSDWVNGKDKDLSAFGCDFSTFQKLTCTVKDMKLNIYLNDKSIFNTPITQTITQIAGICIRFEGSGQIKALKLGNSNKTVLDEKFGN